jgi:hypothetical protein
VWIFLPNYSVEVKILPIYPESALMLSEHPPPPAYFPTPNTTGGGGGACNYCRIASSPHQPLITPATLFIPFCSIQGFLAHLLINYPPLIKSLLNINCPKFSNIIPSPANYLSSSFFAPLRASAHLPTNYCSQNTLTYPLPFNYSMFNYFTILPINYPMFNYPHVFTRQPSNIQLPRTFTQQLTIVQLPHPFTHQLANIQLSHSFANHWYHQISSYLTFLLPNCPRDSAPLHPQTLPY